MGNAQAGSNKGALAQFYAANGADISRALVQMGKTNYAQPLCDVMGIPYAPAVQGGAEGMFGGGESFVGGFDDLQNYGNSMYSKAKEKLIRDIAEDVLTALKAKNVKNVRNAPIQDVVAHLTKALPPNLRNPRKFHENFNKSSSAQREVCRALASSINKHYAGALIDVDGDESAMCNKIAEIMYSLLTGLHTEFMNIAGDAMRVMNNMQLANEYLERAYKKQKELIEQSADARLKNQSGETDKVYEAVKAEYNRQTAILANLMNVAIGPTGKSLIQSLEDNRDFVGLVKNLKTMVGTQAFGDKLSYLLSGISSVAHSAELIDKALKKIGMSAADFKSSKSAGELRSKVFKHIMNRNPSSKQLDEMMAAAKIIYEANYDHDAISKVLGNSNDKRGGNKDSGKRIGNDSDGDNDNVMGGDDSDGDVGDDRMGGDDSDGNSEENKDTGDKVMGGDDETLPAYWQRKSLKKKIDNKQKYRDLVLKDFRKQLRLQLQQVVDTANEIARHVGNGIPADDQLRYFVDAFGQIRNLDKENIHFALSGYPRDSTSKEQREMFLLTYDSAMKAAEPLTKGPQGHLFKSVYGALSQMVKLIDDFNDKMVKALTEIHVDRPETVAQALKRTASAFYGSGDSGDDMFGDGNWVAFDKVKHELAYYFSIANVKTNLGRSHEDLKSYAEDYDQILGEEAAWIIDRIKQQYINRINDLDLAAAPAAPAEDNRIAAMDAIFNSIAALTDEQKKESKENFRSLWTFQMNAKINMIKVAQAVDLYLKAFTDGIARNPDSISSVVKMLNGVEIVAKWFNDRSGDQLASLFDFFPCGKNNDADIYLDHAQGTTNAGSTVVDPQGVIRVPNGQGHYYAYLEQRWAKDATGTGAAAVGVGAGAYTVVQTHTHLPGNPFLGRSLLGNAMTDKQCKGVLQLSQKVVKSMRALENILAAFISVGSKFGDIDPLAKTFMNPGQIFNYLCDYVAASAFTNEFAPTNPAVAASAYHSQTVAAEVKHSDGAQTQTVPTNNHPEYYRPALAGGAIDWSHNLAETQNNTIRGAAGAGPGTAGERGILVGVDSRHNAGGAAALRNKYTQLAMSAIPAESHGVDKWKYHDVADAGTDTIAKLRLDVAGWRDNFFDTDFLFQLVIKSIVAKVFTVVDAYRLFHRPVADKRAHYSLNPLRTILGGSDGGADGGALMAKVKIIPEALELYYRLVLLAEWYRENFGVDSDAQGIARQTGLPANAWRVTLVPSIDGIWSDLVSTIFDKANYIKDGNYTETQCQRIILAVNDIWSKYKLKYPKSTTRSILNAFVLEMNRAFGFLRQSDITSYLDNRRANLTSAKDYEENETSFLDFDILNANEQFGSRPAPSDRFSKVVDVSNTKRKEINMFFLQKAIEDLRKRIDVDFLQVTQNDQYTTGTSNLRMSFAESLRNYRNDMANAKSDSDEYKVVLRMLQSANRYINVSAEKMIMVHETVAAPLTVLYAIYKVMARFNAFCHGTSLNNLAVWNVVRGTAAAAGTAPANVLDTAQNARTAYNAFLVTKYTKIANAATSIPVELFTRALVGSGGAAIPQGYILANPGVNTPIACAQLDAAHLAKDIIAALLDLGTNSSKLVTVSISQNGDINIDTSALEEACKDLLYQVKENIKKLRNNFNVSDVAIVDKYEDVKTLGSTRWLEENLLQQIFADRDEAGLPRGVQHLRDTFKTLTEKRNVATGAAANNIGAANAAYTTLDNAVRGLIFYEYADGTYSLPNEHYEVEMSKFPGNVVSLVRQPITDDEKNGVANSGINNQTANQAVGLNAVYPMPVILFETAATLNSYNLNSEYKSMMQAFNKLLHLYLYMSVEDGSNKFYGPLVESFATSAGSLEVMQGKAFPNVGNVNPAGFNLNDATNHATNANRALHHPPKGVVVYGSNAVIIRSLLNSVQQIGTAQKKKFLFETISEMPEFLKDRMKVNLPFFSKMFESIAVRATMLKQLLNQSNLKQSVMHGAQNNTEGIRRIGTLAGVAPLEDQTAGATTAANTEYYNGLLTRLIDCGHAMRKCAEGVYRELQDKPPAFFEMSKDFLQDYRTRNGGLPLMPFSSFLTPMTCLEGNPVTWQSTDASHLGLPIRENGSNVYKYNYATRLMLNRADLDINMDHFPGAKDLYNAYANSAPRNAMLSSQEYSNTLKHTFKLGKFLLDGAVYGRLFDQPARNYAAPANQYNTKNVFGALKWNDKFAVAGAVTTYTISDMIDPAAVPAVAASSYKVEGRLSILPLVDPNGIAGVVELTENTNLNASKDRISRVVGRAVGQTENLDRKRMRVLNILDAGIVPLNVHAFMREVPFVNLLNYSYTFDRMVHDFVLPSYISNGLADPAITPPGALAITNLIMPPNADTNSTRELLVKLLVNPYADLTVGGANHGKEYFALLASLFNGNDNMKLGRPRYLSDQLWHKALITSSAQLVAGQEMFNNAGANAGNRYPNDYASLEAGPTAYEAVRAVVRHASPFLEQSRSQHNQSTYSRAQLLTSQQVPRASLAWASGTLRTANHTVGNVAGAMVSNGIMAILDQVLAARGPPLTPFAAATFTDAQYNSHVHETLRVTTNAVSTWIDLTTGINSHLGELVLENKGVAQQAAAELTRLNTLRSTNAAVELAVNAGSILQVLLFDRTNTLGNGADVGLLRDLSHGGAAAAAPADMRAAILANVAANANGNAVVQRMKAAMQAQFGVVAGVETGGVYDTTAIVTDGVFPNDAGFAATFPQFAVANNQDDRMRATVPYLYNALRATYPAMHKYWAGLICAVAMGRINDTGHGTFNAHIIVPYVARIAAQAHASPADSIAAYEITRLHNSIAVNVLGSIQDLGARIMAAAAISSTGTFGLASVLNHLVEFLSRYAAGFQPQNNSFLIVPSDPVATSGLKIWDGKQWTVADAAGVGAPRTGQDRMATGDVIYCAELGRMRFDTKLVRNLVWFVQLQRIMRVVLTNHLSWLNTPVVRGLKIADSKITEFEGNENFDDKDFTGENYSVL